MKIEHPKTVEILKWFEEINKIPRCSGNEAQLTAWLMEWAKDNGFESEKDATGNVLIRVPGTGECENSEPVIIQGHMDMVCEKTPDSHHDFSKDPIGFLYQDQWLTADRTTLGADNAIAIAMAMVAALDKELVHPPLELLFTVDEETGLTGAFGLEEGFVKGQRLLNIDSEKEGVFTVGCSGGQRSDHYLPLETEVIPKDFVPFTIEAGGMSGGHSADIHLEKANALKIIARTLEAIHEEVDFRLADLKGGSADNAIPRDAMAVVFMPQEDHSVQVTQEIIEELEQTVVAEFKNTDPELFISMTSGCDKDYDEVFTPAFGVELIILMRAIPHGIYAMSTDVEHFVETSNNFASMDVKDQHFHIVTSQRSPVVSRLDDVTRHISSVVELAGGTTEHRDRYPGWPANMESKLLEQCVTVYENLYKKKPVVETTHGGLECGVIGSKFPGMDMISFGPTIEFPHSPDERIHVGTIGKVWDFLAALLKELK